MALVKVIDTLFIGRAKRASETKCLTCATCVASTECNIHKAARLAVLHFDKQRDKGGQWVQ